MAYVWHSLIKRPAKPIPPGLTVGVVDSTFNKLGARAIRSIGSFQPWLDAFDTTARVTDLEIYFWGKLGPKGPRAYLTNANG